MKIRKISINRTNGEDNLIGFASVEFENDLMLSSISIHRNTNGDYRLNYPTGEILDPEHYWIFHPLSIKTHTTLKKAILRELSDDRYN